MTALQWAEIIDAYRVVPRLLMIGYACLLWWSSGWYMGLPDPTTQQTSFISILWGACGLITGWYFNTGRKWST